MNMEIKLKDEESTLVITDEGFDSPLMWLKLTINGGEDKHDAEIEIPHRELMAALIAFDAKRNRFEEEIKED